MRYAIMHMDAPVYIRGVQVRYGDRECLGGRGGRSLTPFESARLGVRRAGEGGLGASGASSWVTLARLARPFRAKHPSKMRPWIRIKGYTRYTIVHGTVYPFIAS